MITLDFWVSKKVEAKIIAQGEMGVELMVIQHKANVYAKLKQKLMMVQVEKTYRGNSQWKIIVVQYESSVAQREFWHKIKKAFNRLQAFTLWELFSLKFHGSQFLVNRYRWLKSKIDLEEFVEWSLTIFRTALEKICEEVCFLGKLQTAAQNLIKNEFLRRCF